MHDIQGMYASSGSEYQSFFSQIKAELLNVYSIRVLPQMKSSHFIPASFEIWSLQAQIRVKLSQAIESSKEVAERVSAISTSLDAEVTLRS